MEDLNTPTLEVKKSSKLLPIIGTVAAVGVIALAVFFGSKRPGTRVEGASIAASGPVKEFTVDGTNYAFNPVTITVNKGDMVKITFKDDDGAHNLVVDGYNVATNTIGAGSTDTIQFVADKAGSFEYYCAVANHRDLGMTGTLIVQ